LFWKGEPVSIPELMRMLGKDSGEIKQGLAALKARLTGGITLVSTGNEYALTTAPEIAPVMERLQKEELEAPLGKASLETLSIILYKAPVSRREIEYVRGVNSTSILRSLLIRGLIERRQNEKDERMPARSDFPQENMRGYTYSPTVALLSHLGIRESRELPEFENVERELMQFVTTETEEKEKTEKEETV
ncbi:MAG: SMC-Scp complex subunit ScpB, partial [bacterium]|nr:SMC-Scp complex subunit ScpB [bacterium]